MEALTRVIPVLSVLAVYDTDTGMLYYFEMDT